MQYRPEIDGLRTVAVVPVILFHAGVSLFSGGFVGVDVFFVISGFLITSIIIREREENRFSLLRFYERRARRILPALLLVICCCLPFAWHWMLPDPLENFGQSVVATLLSANNILLWMTSGYWELASEFKPLVHTWSLAVEEQYYLLFPLFFLLARRFGMRMVLPAVLLAAGASLVVSRQLALSDPSAGFYLLQGRAWELLAGSICACIQWKKEQSGNTLLSALGLACILAAVLTYDRTTPFPSVYALLPVVGTALVLLYARTGTLTARVLSTRGFVGIGLISYSAYLWHQPLFVFARINSYQPPPLSLMLPLAVVSLLLAALSWKYVETPFRNREIVPLRPFLTVILAAGLVSGGFGLALHLGHGFPARMFPASEGDAAAGMYIDYNFRAFRYNRPGFPANGRTNVLVVGDSFARDFINAGEESGHFRGKNLIYREEFKHCQHGFEESVSRYRPLLADADIVILSFDRYRMDCLRRSLTWLRGQKNGLRILVIGPKDFGYNLNKFMQLSGEERKTARTRMMERVVRLNHQLKEVVPPEMYVDLIGQVSTDGVRMPVFTPEGFLISQDRKHLTRKGARYLGEKIFRHPLLNTL